MNNRTGSPCKSLFPGRVTLELTNSCNYDCVFCPRRLMTQTVGFMVTDLALRAIDELAEHLPVTLVPFFRGEPLLHPNWMKILAYAKKRGIGPIQLTTNGSLLTMEASAFLIEHEIEFVSFSLDTIDSQLYEQSRRGSPYRMVLDNILKFLEMKERSGALLPEIQVSAVDTKEYRPGLDDFIRFWRSKVDRVRVYIEHSSGEQPGTINDDIPTFETRRACFKPFEELIVLWNGEVALCNHDWTRELAEPIANVKEHSIQVIWNSKRYESIRAMHVGCEPVTENVCNHCDHWKIYYMADGYLGKLFTRTS